MGHPAKADFSARAARSVEMTVVVRPLSRHPVTVWWVKSRHLDRSDSFIVAERRDLLFGSGSRVARIPTHRKSAMYGAPGLVVV